MVCAMPATRTRDRARRMLADMTLLQRIGQCIVVGWSGTTLTQDIREAIAVHHAGGVRLSPFTRQFAYFSDSRIRDETGTGVVLPPGGSRTKHRIAGSAPWVSPQDYASHLATLRALSVESSAGVPCHFVIDQEGDTSKDLSRGGMPQFPSALGLSASGDPDLTYRVSHAQALLLRDSGIDVVHSPVLDVNTNPANPEIGRRSFGSDPQLVALHGEAVVRGFADAGVLAVAKHFPGRGDSAVDAHHQQPVLDVDARCIRDVHLEPYRRLIAAGLEGVMIAHCVYPAFDSRMATVSRVIITELLRTELGFEGLVTTDSMTMGALIDSYGVGEASVLALEAGADWVLMKAENHRRGLVFGAVHQALREGRLSEDELNEKVLRILDWKIRSGLIDAPGIDSEAAADRYASPAIIDLEAEAAFRAAVIVKGPERFPLDRSLKTVLVYQENDIKSPNDLWDYPSMFGDLMEDAWPQLITVETAFGQDDCDEDILALVTGGGFRQLVVTSFYDRSRKPSSLPKRLLGLGIPTILVTNTPYTPYGLGGLLPEADGILLNMNLSPAGLRLTRDILLGSSRAGGAWPPVGFDPPGGGAS